MRRSLAVCALLAGAILPVPAAAAPPAPAGAALEPRIAYVRNGNLWTMLPDGDDDLQVTATGRDSDPTWEPGGTRIAFTRRTSSGAEVWIAETASGTPRRLLRRASDPSWAPDGSAIAFVRRRKGNTDIWAVDPDGSQLRRLTDSPASDMQPAWGLTKIAFVSTRGGRSSIWVMASGGRAERRLTEGTGKDRSPAWVVSEEAASAVLHEHVEPGGDHDLRIVDLADGSLSAILVRDDADVTPAGAGLEWFAFVRRETSYDSIRTADVDGTLTSMRILIIAPGLSDPAVPPIP